MADIRTLIEERKIRLIKAFLSSAGIKLLEQKYREELMELIQNGDGETMSELSQILVEEKKADDAINAVAQKTAEKTVKKLLKLDELKTMHEKEKEENMENSKYMTQLFDKITKP